jgi:serpin B
VEVSPDEQELLVNLLLQVTGDPESHLERVRRITDLVTPDNIRELTRLIVVNAIYFKGDFRMRTSLDLGKTLSAMGMPDAFDGMGGADFPGMGGPPGRVYIEDVLHKAFVDVNEEGTEAAAATGVFMDLFGGAPEPVIFHADRPFLFFIREERTGSILFMGRVVDPSD